MYYKIIDSNPEDWIDKITTTTGLVTDVDLDDHEMTFSSILKEKHLCRTAYAQLIQKLFRPPLVSVKPGILENQALHAREVTWPRYYENAYSAQ